MRRYQALPLIANEPSGFWTASNALLDHQQLRWFHSRKEPNSSVASRGDGMWEWQS